MQLFDTHCHVQFADYALNQQEVIAAAAAGGVPYLLCVGCTLSDSELAVEFAGRHNNIWASIGLHPHEGVEYVRDFSALDRFRNLATKPKVVAIGETGLDYYYNHSSPADQKKLLTFQLDMAQEFKLPLIFHVRDAFDDFFKIFDSYPGLQGVVHSFTATQKELDQILQRGLYVGLNGIMTFTKNERQLEAARAVPVSRLLLETDAPFLTPIPYRGKINQPVYMVETLKFLANLRGEDEAFLAEQTTKNAQNLFKV